MIFGKGIRKIEECSLCDTIDTLIFQGKTDKILKNGFDELFSEDFDDDTTLEFPNDFSESFTLCYADVTPSGSKKNPEYRFDVEWAHVKGADGYEIKTEGITQNVENGKTMVNSTFPLKEQRTKMRIIMVLFPSVLSAMLMAENSTEEHTGPTANTKPAAKFIIPKAMVYNNLYLFAMQYIVFYNRLSMKN